MIVNLDSFMLWFPYVHFDMFIKIHDTYCMKQYATPPLLSSTHPFYPSSLYKNAASGFKL